MRSTASGSCSDGLQTNVFPHAIAKGRNHIGTMNGKLNGVIAAKTPIGWRIMSESIPRETSSRFEPCMSEGMPVATSTHSIPRPTSPVASLIVLPLSVVTRSASSSFASSRRYFSSKQARARSSGGVARQPGKAARAARTASSTWAALDSGRLPESLAVRGVDDVERLGALGLDPAASDVVLQGLRRDPGLVLDLRHLVLLVAPP